MKWLVLSLLLMVAACGAEDRTQDENDSEAIASPPTNSADTHEPKIGSPPPEPGIGPLVMPELQTPDSLEEFELLQLRERLAGDPSVAFVSLGARTVDGLSLEPALWVFMHAPDSPHPSGESTGLPIEVIRPPIEVIRPAVQAPESSAPAPGVADLTRRVNSPVGGWQIGPNTTKAGTLALTGWRLSSSGTKTMYLLSAAHVFGDNTGVYSIAKQPNSSLQRDIVGASPLVHPTLDAVIYKVDLAAPQREWLKESNIAFVGCATSMVHPEKGMTVKKIGYKTGKVVTGTIQAVLGAIFLITPTNPNIPISAQGDSGAAWVQEMPDGFVALVGIHVGAPPGKNQAYGLSIEAVEYLGFNVW